MKSVLCLTLPLLVATVRAAMDTSFCNEFLKKDRDIRLIPVPEYSSEFRTTVESTNVGGFEVDTVILTLSKAYQILQADFRSPTNRTTAWVFPGLDTYKESTYVRGKGISCKSEPLEDSIIANNFNIKRDNRTKKLTIPGLRYLMAASMMTSPVFIGEETVRGIKARRWHMCAYQDWSGVTAAAEIYYSQDSIQMPGSSDPVPVMLVTNTKDSNGKVATHRYDYTRYIDHVHQHRSELEVPYNLWCEDGVDADHLLPRPPTSFHFLALQETLGDPNAFQPPKPVFKFVKETYSEFLSVFTEDTEKSSTSKILTATRNRIVHDYTAGLEYDINLSTGLCDVHQINKDSADYLQQGAGFVSMKSPQSFFDLDGHHYQYIGKHYHFDRDIVADVFTAVMSTNGKSVMMTWWFAAQEFLTEMGYKSSFMMPLRFRIQTSDPSNVEEIDIFQFSDKPLDKSVVPDLSPCFPAASEMYLEITLNLRYSQMYLENPENFKAAFRTAMMNNAGIVSIVRVARLRVVPADQYTTLVKFTLLDKPSQLGNAVSAMGELGNDKVWPILKKNLDSGKFNVTVHNDFGKHVAFAVRYSKDYQDPTSFNGRQAMVSSSSSSGYSSGAMGGIGVGMALLGLILGFVGSKGFKKFQDRSPDINMQSLGSRS